VLSRVDGSTSVAEIASISPLGEDETLRCVYALVSAGVVELASRTLPATSRISSPAARDERIPLSDAQKKEAQEPPSASGLEEEVLAEIAAKHASLETADYYALLEVSPGASDDEIKKGYYAMAKKYHPDRHHIPHLRNVQGLLEELFAKITMAYQELSDPGSRRRYDGARQQKARVTADPAVQQGPVPYNAPPEVVADRHYQQGYTHFERMEYFDAIQCLRECVRMMPGEPRYHKLLAKALSKNPNWRKEAEDHFMVALKANEFDLESLLGLAENYEAAGLATRAANLYERILAYDPDHPVAREKLRGKGSGKPRKKT
jgi:curved DNA-binding protein CbpA